MSDHTEFSAMLQRCNERIERLEAELAAANARIARVRRVHVTLEMATKIAAIAGAKSTTNVLEAIVTELFAALHPQGSSV